MLGMIPLARELLRMGSEVVMVANSLPAINDVTCAELRTLLESLCEVCPVLKVIATDLLLFMAQPAHTQVFEVGGDVLLLQCFEVDAARHEQTSHLVAFLLFFLTSRTVYSSSQITSLLI